MPIITSNRHGVSLGTPPSRTQGKRSAKRGVIGGWSQDACRRNVAFLRTIDERELTGPGVAFTGTVLTCPETHAEWHELLQAFFKRVRRLGAVACHWVIEWQRRGVPHIHCCVYFPGDAHDHDDYKPAARVLPAWLEVTSAYGAISLSQSLEVVWGVVGWLQYVAKHASRGVKHYQRSPDAMPKQWDKTGRMWGKWGVWPTCEPLKLQTDQWGGWQYRRACRAWRVANARAEPDVWMRRRRIRSARRMLQCSDPAKSRVRGVSEWIPQRVQDRLVDWLVVQGRPVALYCGEEQEGERIGARLQGRENG